MSKFHVNPVTGKPGICSAKKSCPFGLSLEEHFDNVSSAQAAFESTMKEHSLSSISRVSTQNNTDYPISLDTVLDTSLLKDMVKEGFIFSGSHPEDDNLKIFCYTPRAQNEGKWNEATKIARGLIAMSSDSTLEDAVLIQRPWRKFFTLTQIQSGWALGDEENMSSAEGDLSELDFDSPAEVTDKMDGSMGILYRDPSGLPAFSTKGSFASDQAIYYTNLLRNDEKLLGVTNSLLNDHSDTTFLYELVGANNRIVLKYDKDDIAFLGAVKKESGLYLSTSDFSKEWKDQGLTVADSMPARTLREAFTLPNREGKEGMVVRIISSNPEKQMQIKIKQEDYLRLHKILTHFTMKDVRQIIRDSEATYDDIIKSHRAGNSTTISSIKEIVFAEELSDDKELQKMRKEMFDNSVLPIAKIITEAIEEIDALPQSDFEGNERELLKNFAIKNSKEEKVRLDTLLKAFRARLNGSSLRDQPANAALRTIANRS